MKFYSTFTVFNLKHLAETVRRAMLFTNEVHVQNVSGTQECYEIRTDISVVCTEEEQRYVLEYARGANGESLCDAPGC